MSEREDVVEAVDVQTVEVTTQVPPAANRQQPTADLDKVRELVLKAHPDIVPDLVGGSSVDELIASVEPARTAYQRVADQVRGAVADVGRRESEVRAAEVRPPTSDSIVVQPPAVPAGGGSNLVEPGDLGPTTKIAHALAARKTRG